MSTSIYKTALTDHFPVSLSIPEDCTVNNFIVNFRCFNQVNMNKFLRLVQEKFFDVYTVNNSALAFESFYNQLEDAYNIAFPVRTKNCKNGKGGTPWMITKFKKCIRKNISFINYILGV